MIDRIALPITYRHDVTLEEIISHNRMPHLVRARWELIRELRNRGWSLTRIGNAINRDHTSVLHALQKMGAA